MRPTIAIMILFFASAARPAEPRASSVSFFVSTRNPLRDVSEGDLRRIFLGEISRLSNGDRIVLFVRPADSPEGRLFLDRVARMSDIDYSQWWLGAVFRGRASEAPRVVATADAMLKAVAADADAIGFVSTPPGPLGPDLALITIDGKAASDPAYPIRIR